MASYNRRYSTLHSPDEPQLPFSALHTPVEPNSSFRQSPHGSGLSTQQFTPQSDVYSPPVEPSSFTSHPSTMASPYPTDQFQAQPQPMPSQGLTAPNAQQQQQVPVIMSPNDIGTLSPHSTGTRTPQPMVGSAVPSVHGSAPASPGLPPLPGVDTYMMTPQPPQPTRSPPPSFEQYQAQHHPPQQPMSPPPAFNPLDPNPYDQQQQGQMHPPAPPEPSHASTYNASHASASPVTPKTPVYTPGALAGPNGGVHAPGQIGHPNQQHDVEDYHHGLCDCLSDPGTCKFENSQDSPIGGPRAICRRKCNYVDMTYCRLHRILVSLHFVLQDVSPPEDDSKLQCE